MKKILILLFCAINSLSFSQSEIDDMPELSLRIIEESGKTQTLTICKGIMKVAGTSSFIRISRKNIPGVTVNATNARFYLRGDSAKTKFNISVIKLTEYKKTLEAFYTLNKAGFNFMSCTKSFENEALGIKKIEFKKPLENGYYAVYFRSQHGDNLSYTSSKLTNKPIVFQVIN